MRLLFGFCKNWGLCLITNQMGVLHLSSMSMAKFLGVSTVWHQWGRGWSSYWRAVLGILGDLQPVNKKLWTEWQPGPCQQYHTAENILLSSDRASAKRAGVGLQSTSRLQTPISWVTCSPLACAKVLPRMPMWGE